MNPGFAWILGGVVLCGAELVHPGVFLLWIGLAAAAAGAVTWAYQLAPTWQIVVFMLALGLLLCIPFARRRRPVEGGVNAPDADIVGRTCRALTFRGDEGRVAFRDGVWPARMARGGTPDPDTILRVTGLDGTTLLVIRDP